MGYPIGNVSRRADGKYEQNFQLGVVILDNPNALPQSFTKYKASVTLAAVKCFGTEDPGGLFTSAEDEPYVIISIISVNPNFGGTDTLVQTTRTEILEHVKAGAVIFENRTIGDISAFPGSGIKIHVAIFDHEHGDANALRNKINNVLEDAARKGSGALAAAAAANDPKLAGTVGDITNFEVGGVKPFNILTYGVAGLLTELLADDLIGEHEFYIPAADIVEWSNPEKYNSSLRTSPDLIRFNVPQRPEDEFLFSGGGGSYKIYFRVAGIVEERPLEAKRLTDRLTL
ncbi:hypothetical protein [Paenibacillus sabinae]|uniref:Uncharacterized protein n=1 Tax=Paenibacillus sabinae T27 TaxID=1268072 RepID=X4ZCM1_9BACL|nr:hypothetical protein [Paenibacillus sabinae]AHV95257.1 hypothetical protein PSAB_01605 [Paenibacillus sabinae T27]